MVGATGSIGHLVVEEAVRQGHALRALVRTPSKARQFHDKAQVAVGDIREPETLLAAIDGIEAIVFTHGSISGKVGAEQLDYGGVRNTLHALGSRKVRIALMTAIGVTNRTGDYNRSTEIHGWKRAAGPCAFAGSMWLSPYDGDGTAFRSGGSHPAQRTSAILRSPAAPAASRRAK